MNAVTYIETQALDTRANVLQAADPSKHMILVPLSRLVLRPTGRNVRMGFSLVPWRPVIEPRLGSNSRRRFGVVLSLGRSREVEGNPSKR